MSASHLQSLFRDSERESPFEPQGYVRIPFPSPPEAVAVREALADLHQDRIAAPRIASVEPAGRGSVEAPGRAAS